MTGPATKRRTKAASKIDAHVGNRIRIRRLVLGLSQAALANELNIAFQQIQKYENGSNRVSAGNLHQIARFLGVTPSYFYEGIDLGDQHRVSSSPENTVRASAILADRGAVRGHPGALKSHPRAAHSKRR